MTTGFWDSSALVPLCVQQKASAEARRLTRLYKVVVWWATPVEMRSALERLLRIGELSPGQHQAAERRVELLRKSWREMQPGEALRAEAESLLSHFGLRSADALQLAAAVMWTLRNPREKSFISGDVQLLEAARRLGFHAIEM